MAKLDIIQGVEILDEEHTDSIWFVQEGIGWINW